MSISFSSADGGIIAANPLRTDRISIKGVNWFGAEGIAAVAQSGGAAEPPTTPRAAVWAEGAARGGGGARGVGEGATSSCRSRPTRRSWSTARF